MLFGLAGLIIVGVTQPGKELFAPMRLRLMFSGTIILACACLCCNWTSIRLAEVTDICLLSLEGIVVVWLTEPNDTALLACL